MLSELCLCQRALWRLRRAYGPIRQNTEELIWPEVTVLKVE